MALSKITVIYTSITTLTEFSPSQTISEPYSSLTSIVSTSTPPITAEQNQSNALSGSPNRPSSKPSSTALVSSSQNTNTSQRYASHSFTTDATVAASLSSASAASVSSAVASAFAALKSSLLSILSAEATTASKTSSILN